MTPKLPAGKTQKLCCNIWQKLVMTKNSACFLELLASIESWSLRPQKQWLSALEMSISLPVQILAPSCYRPYPPLPSHCKSHCPDQESRQGPRRNCPGTMCYSGWPDLNNGTLTNAEYIPFMDGSSPGKNEVRLGTLWSTWTKLCWLKLSCYCFLLLSGNLAPIKPNLCSSVPSRDMI